MSDKPRERRARNPRIVENGDEAGPVEWLDPEDSKDVQPAEPDPNGEDGN